MVTAPHSTAPDLTGLAPVPHGTTARRLEWPLLPPELRRLIASELGWPTVVSAESAGAGFTPGFASTLTGPDGQRAFVKAASVKAQRPFADAYREEIRKLSLLPPGLPVPRLLWSHEDDLWVVLALEHVDGRNPARPWDPAELDRCLDTLEVLADALTPAPAAMDLQPMTAEGEFGAMLTAWDHVRRFSPDRPHLEDAAALAADHRTALAGGSLVHTDARDDNFVLTPTSAVLCDWNWPVLGPAWVDSVLLLISAFGDGIDVEQVLRSRRLTRDVDGHHVDVLLALVCGYFLESRDRPVPNSSPSIRVHQSWYAEVSWAWLARRRGWA